jgi:hypothetical protein
MKKIVFISVFILLALGLYLANTVVDSKAPAAIAKLNDTSVYTGTIYVAGMGGHFSAAQVSIDPSKATPLEVTSLDKIDIGSKDTHPTHDPRIDVSDRSKMFWSTYKADKEAKGRVFHVGVSDLKTGNVIKDKSLEIPERAEWIGALYCGSGQTKDSFMPITMSNESFIDVFDKKNLDLKARVYLDNLGYKNNYFFFHGTNSPDLKNLAMTINKTKPWTEANSPAARLGEIDMLLLDLAALEKGDVKVVAKNTITGSPEKTLTFRQSFTNDGRYLLQSGGDRFYLLKGDDLSLVDEEMMTDGENHDAIPTPDGKYAVLTIRSKVKADDGKTITDGMLQLYDMEAKKMIGKPVSTCVACHKDADIVGNATLCGADVNWKL